MSDNQDKIKRDPSDLFVFDSIHEEIDGEVREKIRLREEFFLYRFKWNSLKAEAFAKGLNINLFICLYTSCEPVNVGGVLYNNYTRIHCKWGFVVCDLKKKEIGRATSFDTLVDVNHYIHTNYLTESFLRGVNNIHG